MKANTSTQKMHSTRTIDAKYVASATKLFRQCCTMFETISEELENRDIADRCGLIAVRLSETMNNIEILTTYTAPTRNKQLSMNFE